MIYIYIYIYIYTTFTLLREDIWQAGPASFLSHHKPKASPKRSPAELLEPLGDASFVSLTELMLRLLIVSKHRHNERQLVGKAR